MNPEEVARSNERALEVIAEAQGQLTSEDKALVAEAYHGNGLLMAAGYPARNSNLLEAQRDQFFTPPSIGAFLVDLLRIPRGALVFDPAIGSGRMFLEVAGISDHVYVTGIEVDSEAHRVACALLGGNADILNDDLTKHRNLEETFTYCLGNPPMSATVLDKGRVYVGTGPSGELPVLLAYLENSVRALEDRGFLALVMPNAWPRSARVPPAFLDWFRSRTVHLLSMHVPGGLFDSPDGRSADSQIFAIEVYQKKRARRSKDRPCYVCRHLALKDPRNGVVDGGPPNLHHTCDTLRAFRAENDAALRERARSARCGRAPLGVP